MFINHSNTQTIQLNLHANKCSRDSNNLTFLYHSNLNFVCALYVCRLASACSGAFVTSCGSMF